MLRYYKQIVVVQFLLTEMEYALSVFYQFIIYNTNNCSFSTKSSLKISLGAVSLLNCSFF